MDRMKFVINLANMYDYLNGNGSVSYPREETPGRMYASFGFSAKNERLLNEITVVCNKNFVNYRCEFMAFGYVNITITL